MKKIKVKNYSRLDNIGGFYLSKSKKERYIRIELYRVFNEEPEVPAFITFNDNKVYYYENSCEIIGLTLSPNTEFFFDSGNKFLVKTIYKQKA